MERDAQITIILGRNGTGKSTFCQKIIDRMNTRALAVTYNGMPKIWRPYPEINIKNAKAMAFKKGIRQVIAGRYEQSANKNDVFQYIYTNYKGGSIIWDDCRGYINSSVDSNKYFRQLLLDFRHRMLDQFFVVHSPSDVPPRLWGFASTAWIGATDALVNKSQVKTHSAERIISVQHQVNEAYRKAKAKGDNSHYGIFMRVQL
jgi:ABC-type oligopeptide transport system ATPase subunit